MARALGAAYEEVAGACNALALGPSVDPSARLHGRPYLIIRGERFASALRDAITDPDLSARPLVGAIDQFVDSTVVLPDAARFRHYGRPTSARVAGDGKC